MKQALKPILIDYLHNPSTDRSPTPTDHYSNLLQSKKHLGKENESIVFSSIQTFNEKHCPIDK